MTLYSAINAAREAAIRIEADLDKLLEAIPRKAYDDYGSIVGAAKSDLQALAALPDKPMTEDEIFNLIKDEWHIDAAQHNRAIIRALRNANVLYVSED